MLKQSDGSRRVEFSKDAKAQALPLRQFSPLSLFMFNRYWRSYPWYMQLLLFVLMMFTFMSFAQYLILALMPKISGLPLLDFFKINKDSSAAAIRTSLYVQLAAHFIGFTLLSLLFSYFVTPHRSSYLGFRKPGKPIFWLLSVATIVGLIPILAAGQLWLPKLIDFGAAANAMQVANQETVEAFLSLKGTGYSVLLLFAFVLLPAFGEELVFRGILMRFAHKYSKSAVFSVIASAVLFAAMHWVPYGMPFIFIAGIVLALIYWYTGSIWCSMVAHASFNGLQLGLANSGKIADTIAGESISPMILISGLLVFGLCFYMLYRLRTPLAKNWSYDYLPGEVVEDRLGKIL